MANTESPLKIVCLSDTHGRYSYEDVPDGDVLVHAGDLSMMGTFEQLRKELILISMLPHKHKIIIAGNHDYLPEQNPGLFQSLIPAGVTYLQDSGVTIDGVNFYGTPWVPNLPRWAFSEPRVKLGHVFGKIPEDTHVLITHAPAYKIRDSVRGPSKYNPELKHEDIREFGSPVLGFNLARLKQLKAHIFGHIHDSSGISHIDGSYRVNAAICDEQYDATNLPRVIEVYV